MSKLPITVYSFVEKNNLMVFLYSTTRPINRIHDKMYVTDPDLCIVNFTKELKNLMKIKLRYRVSDSIFVWIGNEIEVNYIRYFYKSKH